jgi:5-carboxymethyl-2-hydroxymuconate isomerase
MPHLVILYTGQLDAETDMRVLCRTLADTMLAVKDDEGQQVFPSGGTRVLAYPAAHWAVSDGGVAGRAAGLPQSAQHNAGDAPADPGDYAFVYLSLRMARGRSEATQQRAGQAVIDATKAHFASLFAQRRIGITLQVDVGAEVFDAKHSNLHPLFAKK